MALKEAKRLLVLCKKGRVCFVSSLFGLFFVLFFLGLCGSVRVICFNFSKTCLWSVLFAKLSSVRSLPDNKEVSVEETGSELGHFALCLEEI